METEYWQCPKCGADGGYLVLSQPEIDFYTSHTGCVNEHVLCEKCHTMFTRSYHFGEPERVICEDNAIHTDQYECAACGDSSIKVELISVEGDSDGQFANWRATCECCGSRSCDMDTYDAAIEALTSNYGPYYNAISDEDIG